MKQAGFFRAAVPKMFGGIGGSPKPFLQSIERVAAVDGSAGWVASFGSSNYYLAALPVETQAVIYQSGPDQMFAGGLFPVQPAKREGNGWIINGQWKFSSGCKTADWIGVGISGSSDGGFNDMPRTAMMPASQVEVVENWEVMGMEGTGSHDLKVEGQFVTEDWTFLRGAPALVDEPLYRLPTVPFSGQVHTAVILGLAAAAIRELLDMCQGQTTTGAPKLADRAYFRMGLARSAASFLSARAYFYEVFDKVWEEIEQGNEVSRELTNEMKLSSTHAAEVCGDVVKRCYNLSGIGSIYLNRRLQKILRDIMVSVQHAHINESVFDGAGAVMTNVEPFKGYL
jgi:alkylation response protein AidB-like acyl-CoA dehydrogenase